MQETLTNNNNTGSKFFKKPAKTSNLKPMMIGSFEIEEKTPDTLDDGQSYSLSQTESHCSRHAFNLNKASGAGSRDE